MQQDLQRFLKYDDLGKGHWDLFFFTDSLSILCEITTKYI
jgi:hypothetical protein